MLSKHCLLTVPKHLPLLKASPLLVSPIVPFLQPLAIPNPLSVSMDLSILDI